MPPKKNNSLKKDYNEIYKDVANKIFEVKEKLTDKEYQELIEGVALLKATPPLKDKDLYIFEYYQQSIKLTIEDDDDYNSKTYYRVVNEHKTILCSIAFDPDMIDFIYSMCLNIDRDHLIPLLHNRTVEPETMYYRIPGELSDIEKVELIDIRYRKVLPISIKKYEP